MTKPTRPVVNYFGGKWLLAPWIIEHFPPHLTYVEPFGGGANVLLRKPRSKAEIYNDIDEEIVELFQVLREAAESARLIELLELTPFARAEFLLAHEPTDDKVERARRTIVRTFFGHGSSSVRAGWKTTFRATSLRSDTHPAASWASFPPSLKAVVARIKGVGLENRPALAVIAKYDAVDTLHYLDPPYVVGERSGKHRYKHDMTDAEHAALLAVVRELKGMVVISGYASPLYDEALAGWRRVRRLASIQGGGERTEVLWINPAAAARLDKQPRQGALFEEVEREPTQGPRARKRNGRSGAGGGRNGRSRDGALPPP
jgi:DNA adenine methylase